MDMKLNCEKTKNQDSYVGQVVDERYEIKSYLGKGATGVVYAAYDIVDKRDVAIKILRNKCQMTPKYIERFKKEAKAINFLDHENLAKVEKLKLEGPQIYIISEYVKGSNLCGCDGFVKGFKVNKIIKYMQQILKVTEYLHNKGVIHKDIRPQNILLTEQDNVKIIDLGVADFPGDELKLPFYREMGEVHYLAPEIVRGDDYDKRADIYSIGILLYRLLTGAVPFDSHRSILVGIMHSKKPPRSVRSIVPYISEELDRITLKAIEKSPENRYGTAEEMLDDINNYADTEYKKGEVMLG